MENWDQEQLTRLLVDLKAILLAAHDFDSISVGVKLMPSAWGLVFHEYTYGMYDTHAVNSQRFGLITFSTPLPARELCDTMDWSRPYASSGDVHQTTWDICLGKQDFPALQWPRDAYESTAMGRWSVKARLTGRPPGPLPDAACGASPAYNLEAYPAEVAYFELLWLDVPPYPYLAMPALGEMSGWICEYWAQGMEEGPLHVFQNKNVEEGGRSEGLHTFSEEDQLTVYAQDGKILFSGMFPFRRRSRWRQWLGLPRKAGRSDVPPGVAPDTWQRWFRHKPPLRAVLRPARR